MRNPHYFYLLLYFWSIKYIDQNIQSTIVQIAHYVNIINVLINTLHQHVFNKLSRLVTIIRIEIWLHLITNQNQL